MADWLTFAVLYVWAGLWFFDKIDKDGERADMDDPVERLLPLACMTIWPIVAVYAPFSKRQ